MTDTLEGPVLAFDSSWRRASPIVPVAPRQAHRGPSAGFGGRSAARYITGLQAMWNRITYRIVEGLFMLARTL